MPWRITKDFKLGSEDDFKLYNAGLTVSDDEFSDEMINQKLLPLGWIEKIEEI
jgi:hypothetical protein